MAALKLKLHERSKTPAGSADVPASDRLEWQRRVKELEELVSRRDKAAQRYEEELAQVRRELDGVQEAGRRDDRRRADQDDAQRQLQRWQNARLARLYHRWQEGDRGSPHLVWEVLDEGFEITPCTPADCAARTEGEFVLLFAATDAVNGDVTHTWHPLEKPREDGMIGVMQPGENGAALVTLEAEYPIQTALPPIEPGTPMAGRWLSAFGERPAGVRALRALRVGPDSSPETKVSFTALAEFLQLDQASPEALRRHLEQLNGAWQVFPDHVEFGRDARLGASGLRLCLPIVVVCDRPSCRQAKSAHDLVRHARAGELCHVCHEEVGPAEVEQVRETWNFHDARVLLIGGDEVGSTFETIAADHRLQITWLSGFGHLEPHAAGLETYDLVAVVVRQVSHTLVRELTSAVRRRHARLAFLKRRGVTGVLRELAGLLKASREG